MEHLPLLPTHGVQIDWIFSAEAQREICCISTTMARTGSLPLAHWNLSAALYPQVRAL